MNSTDRSNSKEGLGSTCTRVFLHAAAAGYRAVVISSVGICVFVPRHFYYCKVMESIKSYKFSY